MTDDKFGSYSAYYIHRVHYLFTSRRLDKQYCPFSGDKNSLCYNIGKKEGRVVRQFFLFNVSHQVKCACPPSKRLVTTYKV